MKDKSVWLCVAFILFLLNGLPGQCSRWKQLSAWSCLPCVNGRAVFLPSKFLLQWYLLFLLSCWYVFLTGIAQHLPRMQSHLVAPYLTHSCQRRSEEAFSVFLCGKHGLQVKQLFTSYRWKSCWSRRIQTKNLTCSLCHLPFSTPPPTPLPCLLPCTLSTFLWCLPPLSIYFHIYVTHAYNIKPPLSLSFAPSFLCSLSFPLLCFTLSSLQRYLQPSFFISSCQLSWIVTCSFCTEQYKI